MSDELITRAGRRYRCTGGTRYRSAYEYRLTDVTEPATPVDLGRIYGARWTTSPSSWEWRWSRGYTDRGYTDLIDLIAVLVGAAGQAA